MFKIIPIVRIDDAIRAIDAMQNDGIPVYVTSDAVELLSELKNRGRVEKMNSIKSISIFRVL